jgi:tRNA(Ile)-lysidine synthase
MACVCAGGGDRLPRNGRVEALLGRLAADAAVVATLAGARIEAGREIVISRDPGRVPSAGAVLDPADLQVWDGRFEIGPGPATAELKPLRGLARRLPSAERRGLLDLPAALRPSLPVMLLNDGRVSCPLLAEQPVAAVRCLVRGRFAAAAGWIASETECAPGPDGEQDFGALS